MTLEINVPFWKLDKSNNLNYPAWLKIQKKKNRYGKINESKKKNSQISLIGEPPSVISIFK
jgi:hypothetical protein